MFRTAAGPLMAPVPSSGMYSKDDGNGSKQTSLQQQESLPKLRITGDALRKLVAEGTSGKTWPRMQSEASGRPPLPFKKSVLSPREGSDLPRPSSNQALSEVKLIPQRV